MHHSHTHITHTHTHPTHSRSHTHTSSLTHTHPTHNIIKHHIQDITHTHAHPTDNIIKRHIQYITHTHIILSHTSFGVGCVPRRSLVSAALPVAFAWQARDLVHFKGVGCTPWCPPVSLRCPAGVPPVSLRCPSGVPPVPFRCPLHGLRRSAGGFCVAGVRLGALQRGRMYAPVCLRCPSGVPWSPPLCGWLLPGRRVPPVSLGLRRSAGGFCVAGVGLGALQRGRMHAPVSLRCPLVSAALPVALQRGRMYAPVSLRCLSGVRSSPPLCRWLWRNSRGTWRYAPVSLWCPSGVPLVSLRCPSGVPPVSLRCPSGVPPVSLRSPGGVSPLSLRCPSAVPWSPPLCRWLLRGRHGAWCTRMYAPVSLRFPSGVPPVSLRCPSGVPWSPPLCKGVGCMPRCPSGVPWSPKCDEEMWAYVCSAAVSRRLVLKRPADFPSSACFGQWGIEISCVWLLNFLQLCANLTRLVDFADQKKIYGCSEAGHGDVSTQLIQVDCLWAYHGLSIHCVCSSHDAGLWHLDNRYA